MKCPRCHGTGKITEWVVTDTLSEYEFPCRKCKGTGEIEVTNEEWFCQLPTTEKSEFLSAMVKQAIKVYAIHGTTWHETVSWWDCWLKEKHDGNS